MGEPLRWRLLVAVVDSLKKISPGNGYHSTPRIVEIGLRNVLQINQHPAIFVTDDSGSEHPTITHGKREHRFRIVVHAFVAGNSQASREQEIARIEEDIYRRLIEDDPELGGILAPTEERIGGWVEESAPDETDQGVLGLLGVLPGSEGELVKHFTIAAAEPTAAPVVA